MTDLAEPTSEVDTDDLNEMYEFLVNAEVSRRPAHLQADSRGTMAGASSQSEAAVCRNA